MEIVSPESVERDYDKKFRQYEKAGVSEYWIVDEIKKKVLLFRLDKDGSYREVRPRKGLFHSKVMDGFWLDPKWLWERPLPSVFDVMNLLLPDRK